MKAAIIAAFLALLFVSASSRSQTVGTTSSGTAADDVVLPPIDMLAQPAPGSEPPVRDPFTPYDTGPNPWSYDQLTAGEKAVVDRGRNTTGWSQTHDAYAAAARQAAQDAQVATAQHELGLQDGVDTGVVP